MLMIYLLPSTNFLLDHCRLSRPQHKLILHYLMLLILIPSLTIHYFRFAQSQIPHTEIQIDHHLSCLCLIQYYR
jgi:hypothetical protein